MPCPSFDGDGPAGIADAMRMVDCMTTQATGVAFGRLFGPDGALAASLTILLTLYVALIAVSLLTGRSKISLSMLTPRMLVLGLVLTFATSWVAYRSVVWALLTAAPDEIAGMLTSGRGSATMLFANQLDRLFDAVARAATVAQTAQAGAPPTTSWTPADLLWLSALMLLLGTVGVLLVSKIALAAMLALGPVFIVLVLFRGTRGLFEGWLKAAVFFALVPLLTVLIGGGALTMLSPLVMWLDRGETVEMRGAVTLFLAASVYVALMAIVLRTATLLTGGWRLSWGGETMSGPFGDERRSASPERASCLPAAKGAPAVAVSTGGQDRIRAIVAGLPPIATDPAVMAGNSRMRSHEIASVLQSGMAVPQAQGGHVRTSQISARFRQPVVTRRLP